MSLQYLICRSAGLPSTKLPPNIDLSKAVKAFNGQIEALTSLLQSNLRTISSTLKDKSIISEEDQQKAMEETVDRKSRTLNLLNVVLCKIRYEARVFKGFVEVLESISSLQEQAHELVKSYRGTCVIVIKPQKMCRQINLISEPH